MTYSFDGNELPVLRLTPQPQPDRMLIRVAGELDLATAAHLPDFVRAMAPEDCRQVHLDLTDLEFIDAAGLTALQCAGDVVRDRSGRMTIGGLRPLARRLIDLTALPVTIVEDTTSRPREENRAR